MRQIFTILAVIPSLVASRTTVASSPITSVAPIVATSPSQGAETITPERVNEMLGAKLFDPSGTTGLWNAPPRTVATLLNLPTESETSYESSFRSYTPGGEAKIVGCRVFSTILTGDHGKAVELSFMLANKGDIMAFLDGNDRSAYEVFCNVQRRTPTATVFSTPGMIRRYEAEIRKDNSLLEASLTKLFGTFKGGSFGRGASTTERGKRWDWNGTTFFLAAPSGEYVVLRLIPTATFDDNQSDRKGFEKAKEEIPDRIQRKQNGDVLLEVPQVDQGPKGYCVPATFARVMRYYGLHADMDLMAKAGNTTAGGGTFLASENAGIFNLLGEAGLHVSPNSCRISMRDIKTHIDRGEPIILGINLSKEYLARISSRNAGRENVTDWGDWSRGLTTYRAKAPQLAGGTLAHSCLIVGYNLTTGEIALSDSWSKETHPLWALVEEVGAAAQGAATVISF